MPDLLKRIISFADEFGMFPESGPILACVSGGADSMCLFEALLAISAERRFTVGVAHYNHKLRGEESLRDEVFAREYCESRGAPFFAGSGDVRACAKRRGTGLEEAARDMRYEFFREVAERTGASRIATAHTADDNAETVIMNLTRGAGANGLSGIPPIRGVQGCAGGMNGYDKDHSAAGVSVLDIKRGIMIVRPMLRVSRADVMLFLNERGVPFVEDSTNSLDVYTRNKIRHAVMPVLKEINPRFNEAAATVAELSCADEDYLSELADDFIRASCTEMPGDAGYPASGYQDRGSSRDRVHGMNSDPETTGQEQDRGSSRGANSSRKRLSADAGDILGLPLAVSGRVIRKLCGGGISCKHMKSVLELCCKDDPSASLSLPGMTVYREYERVIFDSSARKGAVEPPRGQTGFRAASFEPIYPEVGKCVIIPDLKLKMSCKSIVCNDTINKSFTSFLFKSDDVCGKITVRPRREGDTIRFFGSKSTKALKKLFIERRIPVGKRGLVPIISDDSGVLAIYGIGMGDRAVPEPGGNAIQIIFEEL